MDTLQPFIFEHASIRGALVHLQQASAIILNQRPYPPLIKTLLHEALMACTLLAGSLKFSGAIHLQFHGDTHIPLMLVQCTSELKLRGFAKYNAASDVIDYEQAFLNGHLVLVIDQDNHHEKHQSIVPIRSTNMAQNLMYYFAQSEQIRTYIAFASHENQAAGMLLQLMPEKSSVEHEQFWEYAIRIGETITPSELLNLDNETLLHRLYHETTLRLFPEKSITFSCRCDHEKMKQVLHTLGQADAEQLLEEQGQIAVTCDFCNKQHVFDSIDIALLFKRPPH